MKARTILSAPLLLLLFFVIVIPVAAQSPSPQQTLSQYISDLQKNPNDNALREKIIKLVQEMKQKPAISREAERFMNRGVAAVKSAKDANDFKDAVAEFEKATLSAPWLANAYYNLGVAQDKAGLYAAAIRSLKLFVLAEPNAPDIRSVEKLIDEIEYRQEKATKESSPAAIAAKKQKEYEEWLKKIDGRRYTHVQHYQPGNPAISIIDVQGKFLLRGWHPQKEAYTGPQVRVEIKGYESEYHFIGNTDEPERCWTFIISEDGSTITFRDSFTHGRLLGEAIYNWQR